MNQHFLKNLILTALMLCLVPAVKAAPAGGTAGKGPRDISSYFAKPKTSSQTSYALDVAKPDNIGRVAAPARLAASGSELGGLLVSGSNATINSFTVSATPEVKQNATLESSYTWTNGVYVKGHFYTLGELMGIVYMINDYDSSAGWAMTGNNKMNPVFALSMTYSETDDKVYGCFGKNAGMSAFEFATFDVKTATKTPVADLAQGLPAIGADDAGAIYAIAEDGALYTVNKTTGALTKIGDTGVNPGSDLQSMAYDKKGGYFCWVVSNTLYAVDKASGKADKIADMPSKGNWTGLFVKEAEAQVIPSWVDDMKLNFVKDALTGTVSFKMPVKDTSGAALSGMLQYEIDIDGNVMKGDAEAGAAVSREVTLKTGSHTFKVTAFRNGIPGRESTQVRFIGHDTPATPAPVNVTEHSSDNVEITWPAITAGVAGGYIDADKVGYKLVRQPGNVVLAENLTVTTFTDRTIRSMGYYTYEVTAGDGTLQGSAAKSESKLLGESLGMLPPYSYGFGKDGFGFFTHLDANNDEYTWMHDKDYNLVWIPIHPQNGANDWLISPAIQLEKGKNYNLKYNLTGSMNAETERIEILIGTTPDPTKMTKVLVPPSNFVYWLDIDGWFQTDTDGAYYIALHVITPACDGAMYVSGFSISTGVATDAPAAVSGLKVTAAPAGGMSASIDFTAPTKTFGKKDLTSLTSVRVTNLTTGRVMEVKDGVAPGKKLTVRDENPVVGFNKYTVAGVNEAGVGLAETDSAWVGQDVPAAPGNVVWKRSTDKKVLVTWDTPKTGAHGGYINPQQLKYSVSLYPDYDLQVADVTGNSVEFEPQFEGQQIQMILSVIAENEAGAGPDGFSNVSAYGTPYPAPFYENFERAEMHSYPWIVKRSFGNSPWYPLTDLLDVDVKPYNDNGMAVFTPLGEGHRSAMQFPIVDISALNNPALKFWVYMFDNMTTLDILASTDCWLTEKKIGTVEKAGRDGWSLATIDLSAYKGEKNLQLAIEAVAQTRSLYVIVDKISVAENPSVDLSITGVELPEIVSSGSDVPVTVSVTNTGANSVEKYNFEVLVNGQSALVKEGPELRPDQTLRQEIKIPLSPEINRLSLVIKVNCEGDVNPEDNEYKAPVIPVEASRMPAPMNLANNSASESKVELVWSRPASEYKAPQTDRLETYEPGSIGGIDVRYNTQGQIVVDNNVGKIGPYKLIDNDRLGTTYVQGIDASVVPNLEKPMVCQVIDVPTQTMATSTLWAAHSGGRLFCFWKAMDVNGDDKVANDDYLILPKLDSNDSYISFWAKSFSDKYGLESFDIMYSTTGDELADFKLFKSVEEVPAGYNTAENNGYIFYEFYLPEGTTYAAIHYNKKGGGTALLVDDINCTPADAALTKLDLKGYNVYRDKEKVNSALVTTESYTDIPTADGNYAYNVTSVFDLGESRYSNTVNVDGFKGGIDDVTAADGLNVSTDGRFIVISGAEGQNYMICTTDGRIEASGVSSASTRVKVEPGIHIVRVGAKAVSVLVR